MSRCISVLLLVLGAGVALGATVSTFAECYPTHLKCEYIENPLGVDASRPRFSWEIESHRRGERQTAYQILVASSRAKLDANQGDKWDSGKVESSRSVNVVYEGAPLVSRETCYWKVRAWDRDGKASEPSGAASFEMGLLEPGDWKAQWIGAGSTMPFIAGQDSKAIRLNGEGQSIRIPHDPKLKPSREITISAWIKPGAALGEKLKDKDSDWREIYRKEDRDARHVLAIGDGKIWFGLGVGKKYGEFSAPVSYEKLKDGKWRLVTATFDGQTQHIYLDGVEIGHLDRPGQIDVTGKSPAFIGSFGGQSEFFPGGIDDVRVYERALTAEEVKELAGGADERKGIVGAWRLDGDFANSAGGPPAVAIGESTAAPLLRTEIKVSKPIRRARVSIAGLGWCELYVNGRRVSDHVLDPVMTNYDKQVFYVTHDLADYLSVGQNAIGVMLGNGWYSQPGTQRYGASPVLRAQIDIDYADGSKESFVTDERWKSSSGPITANAIQRGEEYDARLEKKGWTTAGYDASAWSSSSRAQGPRGVMRSQLMPAMRVIEDLTAVSMSEPKPGVFVVDLGRVFGGWSRLRVRGPEGTRVTMQYSERLYPDSGLVDKRNHPTPAQTDVYTLKGDPVGEEYEPRFTFHPTRFVQIEGYPGKPTLGDLVGRAVHSDIDLAGGFHSSSSLLNRIAQLSDWTTQSSWYGMPIDCLHREPFPYLEPSETPSHIYARKFMPQFWLKWLSDITSEQRADGTIPVVVPNYPKHDSIDPAWIGNYPILVWYLSQYYDDQRILADHYELMKRLLEHFQSIAEGNLISKGTWGDHMSPGDKPGKEDYLSPLSPAPFLWTGFYYRDAVIMSQIATVLGKTNDAAVFAKLADEIKVSINAKWFDPNTAGYNGGAQTSNALALALNIVPEDKKEAVRRSLMCDIAETHEGKLTTGIIGLTSLVESVGDYGGGEMFLQVLNRQEYPGWGYMIGQGATTMWESWGQIIPGMKRGREECMAMFTTVQEFLYSDVAGIHGPDYLGPRTIEGGFANVRIRPQALGDLTSAEASIKTVRGMVSSRWRRQGAGFILEVSIPGNAQGTVSVPMLDLKDVAVTEGGVDVWRGDRYVSGVEGVAGAKSEPGFVTFEVGSGGYTPFISRVDESLLSGG